MICPEGERGQGQSGKSNEYGSVPVSPLGQELKRLALGLATNIFTRGDLGTTTARKNDLRAKEGYYKGDGFFLKVTHFYPVYEPSSEYWDYKKNRISVETGHWNFAGTTVELVEMVQTGDGPQRISTKACFIHRDQMQARGPKNSTPTVVKDLREAFILAQATIKLWENFPPSSGEHDPDQSVQYILDRARTLGPDDRISVDEYSRTTYPYLSNDAFF